MKAVILAGGRGSRLSEETMLRPKPMVEIGGRPILWHIMKIYAGHGITDFIVCLGYKGYLVKEYFANYRLHASDVTVDLSQGGVTYHAAHSEPWTVTLVDTGLSTETGGRLKRIAPYLKGEEAFCLTYGDGLGNIDIGRAVAFHHGHGKLATMTAVHPPGRFGVIGLDGEHALSFQEKPNAENGFINGGYFVLSPKTLELVEGDETVWERGPLETLAARGELAAFRHDGFWQPMDTLREKEQLETMWASGRAPWKSWA